MKKINEDPKEGTGKKKEYKSISSKRIDELIEEFNDGKAGRGDSPYTEEQYKEFTGQKKGKNNR